MEIVQNPKTGNKNKQPRKHEIYFFVFLYFRDKKGFNVIMKKTYEIAVIPGDGTGPEVVREGIKVLDTAAVKCGFNLNYNYYNLGGDHYKESGEILPDGVLESLASHNAIYLGAIGHPDVKPGILEKGILLKIRFYLD